MTFQDRRVPRPGSFSGWRSGIAAVLVACVVVFLISMGKLYENVPANEYVVIQSPVKGDLNWFTQPGLAWQGFGDVTAYAIRMKYDFRDKGYIVQFNDGGHGTIHGSIQCDLPIDHKMLTDLHRKFPNQEQVENNLIKTATEGAPLLG